MKKKLVEATDIFIHIYVCTLIESQVLFHSTTIENESDLG